jgi:hypothetical protein
LDPELESDLGPDLNPLQAVRTQLIGSSSFLTTGTLFFAISPSLLCQSETKIGT